MPPKPAVPGYEPMLAAYHRAFASELEAMIGILPVAEGMAVLDMACGDGAYSAWLARKVGPSGRVVAADLSPDYLEIARRAAESAGLARRIEFAASPIDALPFAPGTFDASWCAQSLYSLPDPVEALKALARVTKPGGIVAVLEADTLHHVILPWPIEVELAVRVAELESLAASVEKPRKFYVGRELREVFRKAGLHEIRTRTFATDRGSPLSEDERTYFAEYLRRLSQRVAPRLQGAISERFADLVDPDSADFLLDDPDFLATSIDHVAWGRVGREER